MSYKEIDLEAVERRPAGLGGPPVVSLPESATVTWTDGNPVVWPPPRWREDCWPAPAPTSGQPVAKQLAELIGDDDQGRPALGGAVPDGTVALFIAVAATANWRRDTGRLPSARDIPFRVQPQPPVMPANAVVSERLSGAWPPPMAFADHLDPATGVWYEGLSGSAWPLPMVFVGDVEPATGAWTAQPLVDAIDDGRTVLVAVSELGAGDLAKVRALCDDHEIGSVLLSSEENPLTWDGAHRSKSVDAMAIAAAGSDAIPLGSESGFVVVFDDRLARLVAQLRGFYYGHCGWFDEFALNDEAQQRVIAALREGLTDSGGPWRMADSGTALSFNPADADGDTIAVWESLGGDAARALLAHELLCAFESRSVPEAWVGQIGSELHVFAPGLLRRTEVEWQLLTAVAKLCRAVRAGELTD